MAQTYGKDQSGELRIGGLWRRERFKQQEVNPIFERMICDRIIT
jgi:hypothetical protein